MSVDKYLGISSIDPAVWGKSGWIFLNSIALTFNPNKRENHKECYKKFFKCLPDVLPCNDCGDNLKHEIKNIDSALIDNKSLLKWLLNIRNKISEEQGKGKMTMKQSILEIFHENNSNTSQYMWIFVMILILVLLIYILKYYCSRKSESNKSPEN